MLRHSTRLLVNSQKFQQIKHLANHVDPKAAHDDSKSIQEKMRASQEKIQDKIMGISNTAYSRYNEIIGFSEIDKEYKKVTELQESLHSIQNERTLVQLQIANIRSDLANLQTDIHEHRRGEAKYLELMKKEFDVIQQKNKLEEHYSILDKKEREFFSHLQAKINMLHEKSRTHTRQWGIISTIIGATLGIIGTSISAYYRNNDIRKIQNSIHQQFQEQVEQITKDTQHIIQGYDNLIDYFKKYELTMKTKEAEKPKNTESWAGFFKRKTVSVWRWCTFQKPSLSLTSPEQTIIVTEK